MLILTAIIPVIIIIALTVVLHLSGNSYVLLTALPFLALVSFLAGTAYRIFQWMATPLPFNITTTCGQQKSIPGVSNNPVENPSSRTMAIFRTLLDVLFFRSLFRNSRCYRTGEKLPVYGSDKWLWLAAMIFHWSLLFAMLHHLRYLCTGTPCISRFAIAADNIFHIGTPGVYITNLFMIPAIVFLLIRRLLPRMRFISNCQDYFILMMVMAAVGSGMIMRYFFRMDLDAVRSYAIGMMSFSPAIPESHGIMFSVHIVLVSVLFGTVPFSKLLHPIASFFSITRLYPGSSRKYRHVNPWNAPVDVHGYGEWEQEYREKLIKSGYTLESADGGKAD